MRATISSARGNPPHDSKDGMLEGIMRYVMISLLSIVILAGASFVVYELLQPSSPNYVLTVALSSSATSTPSTAPLVAYAGTIYHVFFHSLIVYPELAFKDDKKGKLYKDYMVTQKEFENILESLYQNQFVLIDIHSIYSVDSEGKVIQKIPQVPKGKKPLIVSLDDLNYYESMRGRGFADKLVLDPSGRVATEIKTPDGKTLITRDGDVVPIVDDFVRKHPDFSVGNAKGIIAETGFDGVLGYRTQASSSDRTSEVSAVKPVIAALKNEGWRFASHSYSHEHAFVSNDISLQSLIDDSARWDNEVKSLVGPTDIFIGPFGQVFKENDPRRSYLISRGFRMFCGVGLDLYLHYWNDHVVMDRADIDGYRIKFSHKGMVPYFDSADI